MIDCLDQIEEIRMVTDQQVRKLFQMSQDSKMNKSQSAIKSDMDEKTARKYLSSGKLPSALKTERTWRTHNDSFASVWNEINEKLEVNPGLEAKTLFEYLQSEYPGEFQDGQLRTGYSGSFGQLTYPVTGWRNQRKLRLIKTGINLVVDQMLESHPVHSL
jgi:hypothetical protein